MATLKLVILDCDGVMFSSKEANRHYYNDLLKAFSCPPMTQAELDYVHMHNVYTSVRHIFRNYPEISQEEIDRVSAQTDYTPYLRHMIMEPDLPAFLQDVQQVGFTAIFTNRTNSVDGLLRYFGLESFFSPVMTAGNSQPKPHPGGLLSIISQWGVEPRQIAFLGDSRVDEQAAKGAGVPFWSFRNDELTARLHFSDFFKMITWITPLVEGRQ